MYKTAFIFVFCLISCQKAPRISPAADNFSTLSPPPMGATTYNDELKQDLKLLESIFDQKIDQRLWTNMKKLLKSGNQEALMSNHSNDQDQILRLLFTLPELIHEKAFDEAHKKKWLKAKYLFLKRRFVESALLMSEVLEKKPDFHLVRNWYARAIFFLGNPDLAISHLEKIIKSQGKASKEGLEALYLIGAIIFESNDKEKRRINKGILAWREYLKIAPKKDLLKSEINDGLIALKNRLHNKENPKGRAPFDPQKAYTKEKNEILTAFQDNDLLKAKKLADEYLASNVDKDILTIKARILVKSGLIDEAYKTLKKALEKDERYAPAYHYLGMAYMMKNKPSEAISSWKKVISIDENYANQYNLKQRITVARTLIKNTKVESH